MKWKFSPKKVDPVFWGNPVNLKNKFTILHSHFVLEENCGTCVIHIKNKISNKLTETEADKEELKRSNEKVIEVD